MQYLLNLRKTHPLLSAILGTFAITAITLYLLTRFISRPIETLSTEVTTYRDFLGLSRPIDTTILPSQGDYQYKNDQNTFRSYFKADPFTHQAIKFTYQDSSLSFFTPIEQGFGALTPVEPKVELNQLIYPSVAPQIDLVYTIEPTRLLEEFIVHDATTAAQITQITQQAVSKNISGYQEANEAIFFTKKSLLGRDRTAFTLPRPVMYEVGDKSKESLGITYQIEQTDTESYTIAKVITDEGKAWLADPERVYPIAIDLVIDNADTASNWVSSDPTNTIITQETTIKQEGTGAVKIQTVAGSGDTTQNLDLMEYANNSTAQSTFVANAITSASFTGTSNTTYVGSATIHTLTGSGTFTPNGPGNVEVLVVGGGGGGGGSYYGGISGGGGGGGYQYNSSYSVTNSPINVTIGAGGARGQCGLSGDGCPYAVGTNGGNGGSSVFGSLTALGGGGGGLAGTTGLSGANGGGGGSGYGGAGTGTAGYNGSSGSGCNSPCLAGGGGGAGGPATSYSTSPYPNGTPSNGGIGYYSTITGSYYGGGGAGNSYYPGYHGSGGLGGGASGWQCYVNGSTACGNGNDGTPNTGGGGAGATTAQRGWGGMGGSGVVIIRYTPPLTASSENTIKTEGSYSLKGVAQQTTSLNKTLTRTIGSPLNLSGYTNATFSLRASRTGSNIKIGLHDSGGTTTEVTPNITQADNFQTVTLDLSGVSNANKDAIDQIIITIVNADALNTFYLDNLQGTAYNSSGDTVTRTVSPVNLSTNTGISFWVRSTVAGSYAQFEFGEAASNEQTSTFTINAANTWEQKIFDISSIASTARDGVTKFALRFNSDTSGATFYLDDIQTLTVPTAPTIQSATSLSPTSIRWNFTDNSSNESGFKVFERTASDNFETMEYSSDSSAQSNYNTSSFSATGGTITTNSGYTIHTFTSNGNFVPNQSGNVDALVVAGGGGGGMDMGGGGGGGGVVYSTGVGVTPPATINNIASCKAILDAGNSTGNGVYTIDPDGTGGNAPFQVYCNMTYDGGGWTMAVKNWYGAGLIGNTGAVGSVSDATTTKGNPYKLSDANVRSIIGASNNFDVMVDQSGYNSAYSTGNYEYVVMRNYTGSWTYASGGMPASTSTTLFQSYRISDNALAWTGNFPCYSGAGLGGINCGGVGYQPPQGGAGCYINMGSQSNTGWYHFYMNNSNDDTYVYVCNGAQHSSSFNMNHRWWVRERGNVIVGIGGRGAPAGNTVGQPASHQFTIGASNGQDSKFIGNTTLTAVGGGAGGSSYYQYTPGAAGASGGAGGGASGYSDGSTRSGGSGTASQGFAGGNGGGQYYSGGGGGAGGLGTSSPSQPHGGIGVQNNIDGNNRYWGGGGGGAAYTLGTGGNGGAGGGGGGAVGITTGGSGLNAGSPGGGGSPGSQTNTPGGNGGANTGGGGGGGSHYNLTNKGGNGGSGIVIVRYPSPPLQSYTEGTIKTQGSYSLKGVASQTTSLNQTLTRTLSSPLNLTDKNTLTFDLRATRTGSNIKVSLRDSEGVTTSIAPYLTQANVFQTVTLDLSNVINANKDAIDQITITIINADAANTFYLDNFSAATYVEKSSCTGANATSCDEVGLTPNTQYTRVVAAYNTDGNSLYSATATIYTLAETPAAPTVTSRAATTVLVNPETGNNPGATTYAIYRETNSATCDGAGGVYLAANGASSGGAAVWQTESAWGTVTATGLDANSAYVFCVKARNGDNVETAWSQIGAHNASYVPLGGDFVCTQDSINSSNFINRYVDGNNPGRYVIGVDSGTDLGASSTNTATFDVKSCLMTINSTDTLAVGKLNLSGGSIAIAQGGEIKIGQPLWVIDADGDGYTADNKVYLGAKPTNGRRKNLASSLSTQDCTDSDNTANTSCFPTATGGTITTSGNYKIHTFTSSGTFQISFAPQAANIEYLVVAGGGGGGSSGGRGGGGGGGGVRTGSIALGTGSYTVTVGAGGAAGSNNRGSRGGNSVFHNITSTGGGGGAGNNYPTMYTALSGGSGGGGEGVDTWPGYQNNYLGASGTAGQGYAGGNGWFDGQYRAGGGGGAGGAGQSGQAVSYPAGGIGIQSSISGVATYYGGGGGGGIYWVGGGAAGGAGGNGGGGAGQGVSTGAVAGTANRGGGGGGNAAAGGSGIVIVRYLYQ